MARWTCPRCEREFGAARQGHTCLPGIDPDELLARHPAWVGEIYRALIDHLRAPGSDPRGRRGRGHLSEIDRKLAEFRPRVRSAQLAIYLPRRLDDPRIARVIATGADRLVHVVNLTTATQVDEQLRSWLEEAYDVNTD